MPISTPTVLWTFGDFILFAQAFGSEQSNFDLDGNGIVDFPDFILFAEQFGEGVPDEDVTVTLPGGAKLVMVWIQPGRFLMGSPDSEPDRYDDHEGPQHEVTITTGFYMGKHEVTRVAVGERDEYASVGLWAVHFLRFPGKGTFQANQTCAWREIETFILRKLNEAEGSDTFPVAHGSGVGIRVQGRYDNPLVVRRGFDPYRGLRTLY